MTAKILESFEESNPRKLQLVQQWLLSNVDDSHCKKHLPVCFHGKSSFYLTELPDVRKWPETVKAKVFAVLVDRDMKEDLERGGLINWCFNVRTLVPIHVSKDGNCLLHAISTAIWGVSDKSLMLRRLLSLALNTDQVHRFQSRWLHQRQLQIAQFVDRLLESGEEALDKEWCEIRQCLEANHSCSTAIPHRFLESVHVYALANILKRPIVVMTDSTMRTFSGISLQDNDMGGIYLPLEWGWRNTHRTPVLLGYSHSHFCPLLYFEQAGDAAGGASSRKNLVPLVNNRFEQLPVRFLLQREGPEVGDLLRKYLRVRETVMQVRDGVHNILCAELEMNSLPEELNVVRDYFKDCRQRVLKELPVGSVEGCHQGPGWTPPAGAGMGELLQAANHQGPGWTPPAGAGMGELLQAANHQGPGWTPPAGAGMGELLQAVNPAGIHQGPAVLQDQLRGTHTRQQALGDPVLQTAGQHQIHIPPPSITPAARPGGGVSTIPADGKKCVVPACRYFGDPDLAMMCSSCFKNYTIRVSRPTAARTPDLAHASAATAPQDNGEGYLLSMMSVRCKEDCGYRCSVKTYPYCHECAGQRQRLAQEKSVGVEVSQPPPPPLATAESQPEPSNTVSPAAASPGFSPAAEGAAALASCSGLTLAQGSSHADPTPVLETSVIDEEPSSAASLKKKLTEAEPSAQVTSAEQIQDSQDLMLFGSGHPSSVSAGEPEDSSSPNELKLQAPASSGRASPGVEPTVTQPQVKEAQSQQPVFSSPVSQPPMREINLDPEQEMLISAAMLSTTQKALGSAGGKQRKSCANSCSETAVHKGLCGKCYVSQGMGSTDPSGASDNMKNAKPPLIASSSPAPAEEGSSVPMASITVIKETVTKETGAHLPPQSEDPVSGQPLLPNSSPLLIASMNYVQNWLQGNSGLKPSGGKQESATLGAAPQGFGDKEESEGLGSDLFASGGQCFSSTVLCVGEGCGNPVPRDGKLCLQCQDILRRARQDHVAAMKEQPEEGRKPGKPVSMPCMESSGPKSPGTICVPADFYHMHTPLERQGKRCTAIGCKLFGDPKQASMCWRHYQQFISSTRKLGMRQWDDPINIPHASEVRITPNHITVTRPATEGAQGAGNSFTNSPGLPPVRMSIPPPPHPAREPKVPKLSEPDLGETYYRVAGRHISRCLNPGCGNYGNSAKEGFCNSCAWNPAVVQRTIYGEEQMG